MDERCYYCDEMTNRFAGDPGMWPLRYAHEDDPGKVKSHHVKCVLLMEKDALRWQHVRDKGLTLSGSEAPIWRDIADVVVDAEIRRADSAGESKNG